jgi:hypothetical protein
MKIVAVQRIQINKLEDSMPISYRGFSEKSEVGSLSLEIPSKSIQVSRIEVLIAFASVCFGLSNVVIGVVDILK